ncbi:MAG: glycosyltransferase family 87 protein [Planctomycetota bacterium]
MARWRENCENKRRCGAPLAGLGRSSKAKLSTPPFKNVSLGIPMLQPPPAAGSPTTHDEARRVLRAGLLLALPFAFMALRGRLLPPLWPFLLSCGLAFGAYAVAVARLRSCRGRGVATAILGCALAFRLLLLVPEVSLSDDVYRYLWEGKIGNAGFNPYTKPPDDPALLSLRDAVHERVAHREIPSVYPPLAQVAFRALAATSYHPRSWRALVVLADLAAVLLLIRLLHRQRLPTGHALILAWNPLVVVELAGSGHVDGLALPFLVMALEALLEHRPWRGALSLAVGALAKLHVAIGLPFFVFRQRGVGAFLVFAVVLALAYAPFLDSGALRGLQTYGEHWSFNSPAYDAARQAADVLREGIINVTVRWLSRFQGIAYGINPELLARLLLALAYFAVLVPLLRGKGDLPRRLLLAYAFFILLSPTIHPWYLLWLVPLLALRPLPSLILFTSTVTLSYLTVERFRLEGVWLEETWVRWVEFFPVIVGLALDLVRAARTCCGGSSSAR